MRSPAVATLIERTKLVTLIGAGHLYSHFCNLVLPPLFLALRAEFEVNFVTLGIAVAAANVASGISQIPFGVMVDRVGGRVTLLIGLLMIGAGFILMGFADAFWQIIALSAVVGAGNGVFHPADYSILSARVDERFMGRAVSIHGFTGYAGWFVAPGTMLALDAWFGWRGALAAAGAAGLVIAAFVVWQGASLTEDTGSRQAPRDRLAFAESLRRSLALVRSRPMLMMFAFYFITSFTTAALMSFAIVAFGEIHGASLEDGGKILTAFFGAMAIGVLLGGVIADRTDRHGLVTATAICGCAATILLTAFSAVPLVVVAISIALGGMLYGITTPSRDLLVRAATPPGLIGIAFGFTSTGLGVGGAIGPVVCGWVMDAGRPDWMIILIAAVTVIAVFTVFMGRPGDQRRDGA
jgi:MFS family permease